MTKKTKQDILESLKKAVTPKVEKAVDAVQEAAEQIVRLEKALEGYNTKRDALDGEITKLTVQSGELLVQGKGIVATETAIRKAKAEREEAEAWVSRIETELLPAAKTRLTAAEKELTAAFNRAIDQERPAYEKEMNTYITAAMNVFHDFLDAQKRVATEYQVKTGFRRLELVRWDIADDRFKALIKNAYGRLFA